MRKILVIKLSALGDFVLSIGAMQAIRTHHADAHITLLTTMPFVKLARNLGCFDEVWTDTRPSLWRVWSWSCLARDLRAARFDRIYDLQWSTRTNSYARFFDRRATQWVGVVPGLGVYYSGRAKPIPVYERQAEMLALVGIDSVAAPDLGSLRTDISHYGLPPTYALLAPGSSPTRREKRWPAERYGELARRFADKGLTSVLIRGPAEKEEARVISRHCESTLDIDSNLEQIVEIARGARVAVGNDTGPMHLIAMAGCPLVAVFGPSSDPIKSRPFGKRVEIVVTDDLARLDVDTVEAAVERVLIV